MRFFQWIRRGLVTGVDLIWHFAHGALVVVGVLAVIVLAHTLVDRGAGALRPFAAPFLAWTTGAPRPLELADETAAKVSPRMRAVADYITRKYRVAPTSVLHLLAAVEDAATRENVDPLLMVAVMAVESGFNPIAQSPMGAMGLMQVIPRWHQDKLNDMPAGLLDPATNIRVGARVLKEYMGQATSLAHALQIYNGAPNDPDIAYANRVLEEKTRLEEVARQARPSA